MKDLLQGSMIVLHGIPKVGKTQLASRFPSPILWIATEYGHRYIPEEQKKHILQLTPDEGWKTLSDFVSNHDGKKKYKTVVIDTVANSYDMCMQFVCDANNWKHPSDGAHGKGWNAVKREFLRVYQRLVHIANSMGATFLVIDHSKEEAIETATESYSKVTCSMSGQARSVILPIPDHIWFLGYAEKEPGDAFKNTTSKRALFVSGSSLVEAGCKDPKVKTKVIMPLSKNDPYNQIVKELYGDQE